MFTSLKNIFTHSTSFLADKLRTLFSHKTLTKETITELEKLLIEADTGITTTRLIINNLHKEFAKADTSEQFDLRASLEKQLNSFFPSQETPTDADIYLLVGINGSGKTTAVAKLAHMLSKKGKKCLLVAADTFRAAAQEQLAAWGKRLSVPVVRGTEQQDPSSVVYRGCQEYLKSKSDTLIIDTAGRLQTKTNLMSELEKIRRTISKQAPDKKVTTLLVVDSMLGQNSLAQAQIFNESTKLDGIILTKLDGTGKGGIILSISHELKIPITFISYGEQLEQLAPFNSQYFIKSLLS